MSDSGGSAVSGERDEGLDVTQPATQEEGGGGAAEEKEDVPDKKKHVVASTLPVVLPATQKKRTTLLVQIDSEKLDLEGMLRVSEVVTAQRCLMLGLCVCRRCGRRGPPVRPS